VGGSNWGIVATVGWWAEFWLADESPEHQNFSLKSLGVGSVRAILTVIDPMPRHNAVWEVRAK
jgi:hypothetical protein